MNNLNFQFLQGSVDCVDLCAIFYLLYETSTLIVYMLLRILVFVLIE